MNMSELRKLNKKHGSIISHEAFPVVSDLWYQLMIWIRPLGTAQLGLNFLKDEIPKQTWKYINNSAMMPIELNYSVYMKMCNKSAIIVDQPIAIKLYTVLKQMGKPSFLGKDKIVEVFWGYKFVGYFPPKLVLRARYIFEAGIFEW